MQTKEALGFSLTLMQLQEVTQAKAQLEWSLALELEGMAEHYEDHNSEWFGDKRTNRPGWLNRWTPPSGRSSLRWVRLIWWGFIHGFSLPLPSMVLIAHAQWVKHSFLSPLQNLRVSLPWHQWVAQHIGSALCLQFPLHWTSQQPAIKLGNLSLYFPLVSNVWNGTAPCQHTWTSKQQEGPCWDWGR